MSQHKQFLWPSRVAAALALTLALNGCERGGNADALIAEARQYRQQGEIKAAVIQLKNVIQKDANHRGARLLLGEVYLEQGDAISAEKELRRAIALGADSAQLYPLLGKAMLMQGHFERVLDEIKPAAAAGHLPAILALRANALMGMNNLAQARAMFGDVLELDPVFPDALLGLARIAASENKADEAAALVARALAASPGDIDCLRFKGDLLRVQGKGEAALAAYRQILALRPHNAQAHVDVANLYIDSGKFKEARSEIESARKASPGTLSVFYSQAMLDFREGKHAAALESLQQILRAAPDHFPSVLLAGAVQSALGSSQQAEQHLKKFLAAYPHHLYATKLMASLQLRANLPQAALDMVRPLLLANENDVELLTLAGEASMRLRHFSGAAEYFEKASALRPDAPLLHTALALSQLGNGDSGRAVGELERAASQDRKSTRTGVLLVMTYLRSNSPDKAMATITEMQKLGDNPLFENLRGGVYVAKRDLRAARASFDKALELDPLYMPALDNLAQLDNIEKRPEQAVRRYQAALGRAPASAALMEALARLAVNQGKKAEAMAWMERAYKANPDTLALGLRLADFYARAGEKQKALALAQQLQGSNPSNPDALALLAQIQCADENLAPCVETYTRLVGLVPGSPGPHMRLATVQLRMKNQDGAVSSLRKVLSMQPDLLEAQMMLLNVLIGQNKFGEALLLASKVQKRLPDSSTGYKLEGDVLSAQDKAGPALKAYERAFALDRKGPQMIQLHGALVKAGNTAEADARMALWLRDHPSDVATRMYYASSKLVKHDSKAAITQLEAVLKLDPKNVVALNDLAWSYQRIGDKHALAYAERAYGLAPNSPVVMDTLGWINLENGNLERALPLLQKAAAKAPAEREIGYHLGVALAKSGDKRGARKEFERLLAAPGDFPRREEVKAFLAKL